MGAGMEWRGEIGGEVGAGIEGSGGGCDFWEEEGGWLSFWGGGWKRIFGEGDWEVGGDGLVKGAGEGGVKAL